MGGSDGYCGSEGVWESGCEGQMGSVAVREGVG